MSIKSLYVYFKFCDSLVEWAGDFPTPSTPLEAKKIVREKLVIIYFAIARQNREKNKHFSKSISDQLTDPYATPLLGLSYSKVIKYTIALKFELEFKGQQIVYSTLKHSSSHSILMAETVDANVNSL